MKLSSIKLFCFLISICLLPVISQAEGTIHYTISFPEPHTHHVEVEIVIDNLNQDVIEIQMPVWTPGSYKVREYSKHVIDVSAAGLKGNKLAVENNDKNTWVVNTSALNKIKFKYKVYAYELSVRTSFINAEHAYLNGTSIFMYVKGMQNRMHTLTVVPFDDWKKISTGLTKDPKNYWKFNANNYDFLVDCPIEIGNQHIFEFNAEGAKHIVAMVGEGNYNEEKVKKDLTTVTEICTEIFGELPIDEYTYIIQNTSARGGGLEHLNSTSLQLDRWSYEPQSSYLRFIGLAIHEYFHLWNVKRLRPEALGPFDYTKENYTTQLWVMEGVTSYYDDYLQLKGNFIDDRTYLGKLASAINRVENQPATEIQSLSESSLHTWIKFYQPHENSFNTHISYYTKGSVVAAMLDLLIIKETDGERNLGDLMKYMYNKYYKEEKRGYKDYEIEEAANFICGSNIHWFFEDFVYKTVTIDYDRFLEPFGLKISNLYDLQEKPILGIRTKTENGKLIITRTVRGTPAYNQGLDVNDEILAADGYRISNMDKLNVYISRKKVGDNINLLLARDGKLLNLPITLKKDNSVNYALTKIENPSASQTKLYDAWLK